MLLHNPVGLAIRSPDQGIAGPEQAHHRPGQGGGHVDDAGVHADHQAGRLQQGPGLARGEVSRRAQHPGPQPLGQALPGRAVGRPAGEHHRLRPGPQPQLQETSGVAQRPGADGVAGPGMQDQRALCRQAPALQPASRGRAVDGQVQPAPGDRRGGLSRPFQKHAPEVHHVGRIAVRPVFPARPVAAQVGPARLIQHPAPAVVVIAHGIGGAGPGHDSVHELDAQGIGQIEALGPQLPPGRRGAHRAVPFRPGQGKEPVQVVVAGQQLGQLRRGRCPYLRFRMPPA